jgi:hypothetical protein
MDLRERKRVNSRVDLGYNEQNIMQLNLACQLLMKIPPIHATKTLEQKDIHHSPPPSLI